MFFLLVNNFQMSQQRFWKLNPILFIQRKVYSKDYNAINFMKYLWYFIIFFFFTFLHLNKITVEGLCFHHQHHDATDSGPWFYVSSERQERYREQKLWNWSNMDLPILISSIHSISDKSNATLQLLIGELATCIRFSITDDLVLRSS